MGLRYSTYLDVPSPKDSIYGCKNCRTHLSVSGNIISDNFHGKHGDAYLMNDVVNVMECDEESRKMATGYYVVRDIACHQCNNVVGWKYCKANSPGQSYKEGKFILEIEMMTQVR